jgi:hypothetical protein
MGGNGSKITEINTHVSTKNIQQIKSPFDDLKKHILTESDLTSYIHLMYIELTKASIEYRVVSGQAMTTKQHNNN